MGRPAPSATVSVVSVPASASVAPLLSYALAERDPTLDEHDPAAPPAQLAEEIAAFTDLPTCVKRRQVDPLLADGLEALGYDNFLWDACRLVQALKENSVAPCRKMMSTAMKRRCEADVAAVSGKPEVCPLSEVFPRFSERDPSCLAAARRDARPCAALAKTERARCEGVVARDASRCGTDARCLRQVGRMRSVLPTVLGKTPPATRLVVRLTRKDESDPSGVHVDVVELPDDAAAGVSLMRRPAGVGLVLGHATLPAVVTPGRAYLGFLADVPEAAISGKEASLVAARFWLYLPGGELLSVTSGTLLRARAEVWSDQVDAPVSFTLSGNVGGMATPREMTVRVETWVRDRVEPKPE